MTGVRRSALPVDGQPRPRTCLQAARQARPLGTCSAVLPGTGSGALSIYVFIYAG